MIRQIISRFKKCPPSTRIAYKIITDCTVYLPSDIKRTADRSRAMRAILRGLRRWVYLVLIFFP